MQTTSISISTLCVPCENRCRYCLLSWDGKLLGADYERSRQYAYGFYNWLKENRPEISFQFYYGYAMEHPNLPDAIDFAKSIGSAGGDFLQLDGLKFRTPEQTKIYLETIHNHGIRAIDLTFYGTEDYHDRFAGRRGDFSYMLNILEHANDLGLDVTVSIPITSENSEQMEELLDIFDSYVLKNLRIFIPHREGRGASLENIRLTESKLLKLSSRVTSLINLSRYKSEARWIRDDVFTESKKRMIGISLTPVNIDFFENMSYEDAVSYVEALDDGYYRAMPTLKNLAKQYGNVQSEKIFDQRDLYLYYQNKYITDNKLTLYDINDERQCFSRRF